MTTSRTATRPHVLLCKCVHYEIIPHAVKEQVFAGLSQAGLDMDVVDDLCGLAAQHDPRMQTWAQTPGLVVVACFPRAVRWLFHAAGAPFPGVSSVGCAVHTFSPEQSVCTAHPTAANGGVRFFNLRTQPAEEIVSLIADCGLKKASDANPQSEIRNSQSNWVPWFPVIDYDRCKNCKQCLNFCLFGVYQLSPEGKVTVQNPAGCKTNCPACARMCPQKAIISPKYAEAPINGDESSMGVPPMNSNHGQDARATGDLYDRIRQRGDGRKRFSTEPKEETPGPSCPTLEGLRRELGIPDEVLAALSPAELQRAMARKSPGQAQPNSDASDGGKNKERND